jgi:hypothetical protein
MNDSAVLLFWILNAAANLTQVTILVGLAVWLMLFRRHLSDQQQDGR